MSMKRTFKIGTGSSIRCCIKSKRNPPKVGDRLFIKDTLEPRSKWEWVIVREILWNGELLKVDRV